MERCIHGMIKSTCGLCNKEFLKQQQKQFSRTGPRKLTRKNFKFPELTDSYIKILEAIMENGMIIASIPNDKSSERFDYRYHQIKGCNCDYDSEGYIPYKTGGEKTWAYKLIVRLTLPDGITTKDFYFTDSIEFVTGKNRIEIRDNSWVHGLLRMGFDLGRNHDTESILEWICEKMCERT